MMKMKRKSVEFYIFISRTQNCILRKLQVRLEPLAVGEDRESETKKLS